MELSQAKLFTFDASSFSLDPSVEDFLKSKGAISVDPGTTAYISSEAMPGVLLELTRLIGMLKAENARFQASIKNAPAQNLQPVQGDDKLRQSYEKLQKEFQALRAQSAEALTSLKVLEDENEELTQELEMLKNRSKNAAAPKAG
jgi:hypothetical protein